jgi:hypothetical protein
MSSYGNALTEYNPQMESGEFEYPQEVYGEGEYEYEGVFSEQEEMELAAELLEVTNEQELEQFLGSLIKKVGGAVGSFVKGPIGKAVGGVLKTVAGKALPIAGGALGTFFGGPLGATIGSNLGSMAGKAFGLELEGLSQEDQEFEAAKQFVKFAADTVKNSLSAAPNANPAAVAHAAAVEAARTFAPGLLAGQSSHGARTGRWERRNGQIIVFGV